MTVNEQPKLDLAEAAKPFVAHYEAWMDEWPDDAQTSTFARVTFGQLRTLRALIARVQEAEGKGSSQGAIDGRGALPTPPEKPGHSEWFKLDVDPEVGRKFIALYSDGSGAAMFWRHDEGVIDQDGDDSAWPLTKSYDRWAYLPDNLEFWCETGEEPMTLRLPQHSDGGEG